MNLPLRSSTARATRLSLPARLAGIFLGVAAAAGVRAAEIDYTALDLTELAEIKVVTATLTESSLADTAASVTVLGPQDLRRSGVGSLPDALRLVPGTDVARVGASTWGVTIRGFGGEGANMLQVLRDGRTLYSGVFAGVNWELQDLDAADVERIEIVRGPGASAWGSNAVNGVVNVITRPAEQTLGSRLEFGAGTDGRRFAVARHGFASGQVAARVYAKHEHTGASQTLAGADGGDAIDATRAGFRLDWRPATATRLTVSGERFTAELDRRQTLVALDQPSATRESTAPQHADGGFLLARLQHETAGGTAFDVRASWDALDSDRVFSRVKNDDFNLAAQAAIPTGDRHLVTTGVEVLVHEDAADATRLLRFAPAEDRTALFGVFVQDEITLVPERWNALLGARLEHHDYAGWYLQPTLRLLFHPTATQTWWAGASRAVRRPSRIDHALDFDAQAYPAGTFGALPTVVQVVGNPAVRNVRVNTFELGYRWQPLPALAFDATAFHSDYADLVYRVTNPAAIHPVTTPAPAHLVLPSVFTNAADARSFGGEATVTWNPATNYRFSLRYSFIDIEVTRAAPYTQALREESFTPRHQFGLRSSIDLGGGWLLDADLRHASARRFVNVAAFTDLDLRLAWKLSAATEFALAGRNLLHARRVELPPVTPTYPALTVERTGEITLSFSF